MSRQSCLPALQLKAGLVPEQTSDSIHLGRTKPITLHRNFSCIKSIWLFTFHVLLLQVDAERSYHQNAADILNKLHDEVHGFHIKTKFIFSLPL
jgi:hypothetical protein